MEQGAHQVCGRHGVDSGLRAGCGHTAPLDSVIIAPTAHTSAGEVPENWPKGEQPLNPEHHLIAGQGNDEEVQHKFLRVDEELDVGADASAGHPVAIGDGYMEPGAEQRLEVETTGRLSGDDGMGGAGVDKGGDGGGVNGDPQLHRFDRSKPSDHMEGDERRGIIQLLERLWRVQLQEENPFYQANFEMLFGELLDAIVALAPSVLSRHLCCREAFEARLGGGCCWAAGLAACGQRGSGMASCLVRPYAGRDARHVVGSADMASLCS
jgi:hypothetical protein